MPRLRVGSTLAAAARVYASNARLLIPAAVVVFAPLGLLGVLTGELEVEAGDVDARTGALLALEGLAQFAALALGEVFFAGFVVAVVSASRAGEHRPSLWRVARRLPWARLIAADLIITAGTALGLVLLIVPGLVFFVWYGLTAGLIEMEQLRLGRALRRSRRLVRGCFWPVLVLLGGSYFASTVAATAAEEGDLLLGGHSVLGDWLTVLAVDVATTPVVAVITVVLAYELKRREEGAALSSEAA